MGKRSRPWVVDPIEKWGIYIVCRNGTRSFPVPELDRLYATWKKAQKRADELNEKEGIDASISYCEP